MCITLDERTTNIHVGDVVRITLSQQCETLQPTNILGVVRKLYYSPDGVVSAYGVDAYGEIVYYLVGQVEKVPGVIAERRNPIDIEISIASDNIIEKFLLAQLDGTIVM